MFGQILKKKAQKGQKVQKNINPSSIYDYAKMKCCSGTGRRKNTENSPLKSVKQRRRSHQSTTAVHKTRLASQLHQYCIEIGRCRFGGCRHKFLRRLILHSGCNNCTIPVDTTSYLKQVLVLYTAVTRPFPFKKRSCVV